MCFQNKVLNLFLPETALTNYVEGLSGTVKDNLLFQLIEDSLHFSPDRRIRKQKLLEHAYFKQVSLEHAYYSQLSPEYAHKMQQSPEYGYERQPSPEYGFERQQLQQKYPGLSKYVQLIMKIDVENKHWFENKHASKISTIQNG